MAFITPIQRARDTVLSIFDLMKPTYLINARNAEKALSGNWILSRHVEQIHGVWWCEKCDKLLQTHQLQFNMYEANLKERVQIDAQGAPNYFDISQVWFNTCRQNVERFVANLSIIKYLWKHTNCSLKTETSSMRWISKEIFSKSHINVHLDSVHLKQKKTRCGKCKKCFSMISSNNKDI